MSNQTPPQDEQALSSQVSPIEPLPTTTSSSPTDSWASILASASPEDCVETLQQISRLENVTGLTAAVVDLAGHDDEEVRMWAGEALERAIVPQVSEIEDLKHLLEDHMGNFRRHEISSWSATMLGRLGSDASSAATSLQQCLDESPSLIVRQRSAWALAQMGAAARVAKDSLERATHDSSPKLQRLAKEALRMIGDAA
ncbi:hypothetical protein Pla22_27860 [Rubripirellula amarantea]|uniref:HEAT repeat protein n=1 Tax=Rubripirellula amarantea TaxID=2527999 RepID=A0A5C5WYZ4_9BACT|nr:HEAT repeat domain-containing protein [Rubripirellula amarantea]TWT55132.1 hypothetical protein Pla22_27860 [Rubripirellula amarantea]